jgi:epoxyqueuosine reductase
MGTNLNIDRLQKELETRLIDSGAGFVGFADISDMKIPDCEGYPAAISICIPYNSDVIDRLDSDSDAFGKEQDDTYERMENLMELCRGYIEQEGFSAKTHFSKNLPGLRSTFSHKMAATKAGLGWIGKNCLLISYEFGCRVRLATVLTNAPFISGTPVTESECGDCVECVEACTYHAIKGKNWYPGIERDNLLDAFLCHENREEYVDKPGYRHPCGLCLKACPVGKRERK